MTDPVVNTTGHVVDDVVMVAEVLRDGQVVGVESLGPFHHDPRQETTFGVPLDRDWPIDLGTDTCRLSLVWGGSQPATRWIGAGTEPSAPTDISYWVSESDEVMAMENSGTSSILLFTSGLHHACWVGELQGDRWIGQQGFLDADPRPASYRLVHDEQHLVLFHDDGEGLEYSRISLDEARQLLTSASPSHSGVLEPSRTCG